LRAFRIPPETGLLISSDKFSSKKTAINLLILQGGAEPLSSVHVWEEPSQLLIGMWVGTIHEKKGRKGVSFGPGWGVNYGLFFVPELWLFIRA
jgi:hypothetical protein